MSDCGCDIAMGGLEDFLHNEAPPDLRGQIHEHLAACPPCEGEWRAGVVLTEQLRGACCEQAPDGLKGQIVARLDAADR